MSYDSFNHICLHGLAKFRRFAVNVWDVDSAGKTDEAVAGEGLARMEAWMKELGAVMSIGALGVTREMLEDVSKAVITLPVGYQPLMPRTQGPRHHGGQRGYPGLGEPPAHDRHHGRAEWKRKAHYLPDDLATDARQPGVIQTGDLMLYGTDCLVLFYKSFSSGYSYTWLGSIQNPNGLAVALGGGSVEVTFRVG